LLGAQPARTRFDFFLTKFLYVAKRLDIIHEDSYQKGHELLIQIIMMLTKLAQKSD
jgi:hypothetical protein